MNDLVNLGDGYSVKVIMLKGEKGDKGDSGTSGDYAGLTNKPQINNIELNGNMSPADLGIASVGSVEQVDGKVDALELEMIDEIGQVQRNFATVEYGATAENAYSVDDLLVYNGQLYKAKTAIAIGDTFVDGNNIEATNVANEINDVKSDVSLVNTRIDNMDVSAVGGSGKYIASISQSNGVIDATVGNIDTSPTSDSSALITSGGVYDELNKIGSVIKSSNVYAQIRVSYVTELHKVENVPKGKYIAILSFRVRADANKDVDVYITTGTGSILADESDMTNNHGEFFRSTCCFFESDGTTSIIVKGKTNGTFSTDYVNCPLYLDLIRL